MLISFSDRYRVQNTRCHLVLWKVADLWEFNPSESEGKYRRQKIVKNSSSGHHRTNLSGYIFAIKARIDNRKLVKQQYFPHTSSQYGLVTAEIGWVVWCTPPNVNGFRVLAALLHGTLVVGVS